MQSAKEAYLAKLQARLDIANAELDKLEARGREARAEGEIHARQQLDELRARRDAARRKITEIQNSTEEAWEHLRQGADEAWRSLENAGAKAVEAFR